MRKSLVVGLALAGFCAASMASDKQVFDCVDSKTLNQDGKCVAKVIEQNDVLQAQFAKMQDSFEQQDVSLLSIVTLEPKKNHITVLAYQNNLDTADE